jgi:hypothetical protein
MHENIPYTRPLNNRKQRIVGYFSGQNIHMTELCICLALQMNTCPSKSIESNASFRNSGSRTDLHRGDQFGHGKCPVLHTGPDTPGPFSLIPLPHKVLWPPKDPKACSLGLCLVSSAPSPCLNMYSFRSPGITDV